jgi:hypothetical protein
MDCPKCKQPMQEGFPLDRDPGGRQAQWVEGRSEYGLFGLRWVRRKRLPITSYRCPSCGYLESYAK